MVDWGEFCMGHKVEGSSNGQLFNFGEILEESCEVLGGKSGVGGVGEGKGCDGVRRESISQYLRNSQGSNEQANGRFFLVIG
jgi:hypothetical protein